MMVARQGIYTTNKPRLSSAFPSIRQKQQQKNSSFSTLYFCPFQPKNNNIHKARSIKPKKIITITHNFYFWLLLFFFLICQTITYTLKPLNSFELRKPVSHPNFLDRVMRKDRFNNCSVSFVTCLVLCVISRVLARGTGYCIAAGNRFDHVHLEHDVWERNDGGRSGEKDGPIWYDTGWSWCRWCSHEVTNWSTCFPWTMGQRINRWNYNNKI